MSLGSAAPSRVLANALSDAHARGITTIAAAGNEATHVAYPAAFPTVIAVSALGRFGTFPRKRAPAEGRSVHRLARRVLRRELHELRPRSGRVRTGRGGHVDRADGYAAWDGTSMACPMITALTALALERTPRCALATAASRRWSAQS